MGKWIDTKEGGRVHLTMRSDVDGTLDLNRWSITDGVLIGTVLLLPFLCGLAVGHYFLGDTAASEPRTEGECARAVASATTTVGARFLEDYCDEKFGP